MGFCLPHKSELVSFMAGLLMVMFQRSASVPVVMTAVGEGGNVNFAVDYLRANVEQGQGETHKATLDYDRNDAEMFCLSSVGCL